MCVCVCVCFSVAKIADIQRCLSHSIYAEGSKYVCLNTKVYFFGFSFFSYCEDFCLSVLVRHLTFAVTSVFFCKNWAILQVMMMYSLMNSL